MCVVDKYQISFRVVLAGEVQSKQQLIPQLSFDQSHACQSSQPCPYYTLPQLFLRTAKQACQHKWCCYGIFYFALLQLFAVCSVQRLLYCRIIWLICLVHTYYIHYYYIVYIARLLIIIYICILFIFIINIIYRISFVIILSYISS